LGEWVKILAVSKLFDGDILTGITLLGQPVIDEE